MIYETTGYGDIREGTEDFPELWNYSEPELKTITVEEANERFPATFDNVPDIIDTLAVEAPQPEVKPRLEIFGLADLAKARKAKQAAASTNVDVELESPVLIDLIDLTADEDASENASICMCSPNLSLFSHSNILQPRNVVLAAHSRRSQPSMMETMVSKYDP